MACPMDAQATVERIVAAAAGLPGVVALSLGGSTAAGFADEVSDLDVYVFWKTSLAEPDERALRLARCADEDSIRVGIHSWGLEDHLKVDGRAVELIYVYLDDLLAHVEQAYGPGLNSEGFTTAQLYTVANGRPVYDPTGALAQLRDRLNIEFPDATRRLILQRQTPLLSVYLRHLQLAQRRGDLLFVQHRRYTLQMVFFNLLFTLNRMYHPGEKRLLEHSVRCPLRPIDCEERWTEVTHLAAGDPALSTMLGTIVEDLQRLIRKHSDLSISSQPW